MKLVEAANNQKPLGQASAVIVACSNSKHVMTCGQPIAQIDVSIALEHIALQATELGLATCWIGSFFPEKVRAILDIPDDVAIIELMTLGYPADKAPEPKREPVENIACFEKWLF
jgi:nitroreductase